MNFSKILAIGKYSPDDILVSIARSNRKIDPEAESKIEAIWLEEKKRAEEAGKICYNGMQYRLNSIHADENKIEVELGNIDYKTVVALFKNPASENLAEEYQRKNCHVSVTARTTDGKCVMVELSGKSMNSNTVDFLGGMLERPLEIKAGQDIFQAAYSEMNEEAGIKQSDILEIYLRAVLMLVKSTVCFYFEAKISMPSNELQNRFEKSVRDQDIASLRFIDEKDYVEFLGQVNESKRFIGGVVMGE